MNLPIAYQKRMESQLGGAYAAYLRAMEEPPRRALRVNQWKISPEEFRALADFPLEAAPGLTGSFFFPEEIPIGRHPLHLAGLCYVQEPAAQVPLSLLPVEPGWAVLDLCAAPGGKSGQIGEKLRGKGLLLANEPVRPRADALMGNLERLGIPNAVITNLYPEALCAMTPGFFDAVVVDAPCSGEGMFRKEPMAVADWSEENVRACAARQLGILLEGAGAVKPGGYLLYATCTFSPEEDEGTVERFLAKRPDFSLWESRRLYPHTFPGEGQYMALLRREGTLSPREDAAPLSTGKGRRSRPENNPKKEKGIPEWDAFVAETLVAPPPGIPRLLADGRMMLLPEALPPQLQGMRMLRAGVPAGELRNGRFVPAHGFFLSLPREAFLQSAEAAAPFLSGETMACSTELSGWCPVCFRRWPLGFGKASGGVMKNHIPKGLRLR